MSTERELVVIGAGGFAAEVIETAESCGWRVAACFADDVSTEKRSVMGVPCAGPITAYAAGAAESRPYVFAIGNNAARRRIASQLDAAGRASVALVHPCATVSRTAVLAGGAFVGPHGFVGPHVRVGEHAIVNVGASIGHDATIGAWAQVCPGARVSGFCTIGAGAFIGSNASLAPRVAMGEWARLAAGSFAARDIPAERLAVGVPARLVTE